jgi:phage terminase large subunit
MSEAEINLRYSARQAEANEAAEQFVLYGGAKGGGKSWWLCCWAFEQSVSYPGNRGFLGRKRGVDFNNTTLETWKKAIPANLWKLNEQKKRLFIPAFDSYIDYGGLDSEEDVQKFNSAEYGFFGIDQAEEISRDAFSMLRGTLRHQLPDGETPSYKVRLTANPAQCWLRDEFILKAKDNYRFIKALPSDNPFLAKGYIQNLAEAFAHRPELLQAYLYGSWDELAGADTIIQPKWVEGARGITISGPPIKRIVVCDPAHFGDDETVIYVMEQMADGTAHVLDTEIVNHKTTMDTAGRIMAKRKEHDANMIVIDSIGLGVGIAERLLELEEPVLQFVSSRKPDNKMKAEKYTNLRAQIWFDGAQKIYEGKAKVPEDEVLIKQLSAVCYEYASNGRFKVESKQDIKAKIGASTDRPDAFLMGLYGLDIADRLDTEEYRDATEDRQGEGVEVKDDPDFTYCADEF